MVWLAVGGRVRGASALAVEAAVGVSTAWVGPGGVGAGGGPAMDVVVGMAGVVVAALDTGTLERAGPRSLALGGTARRCLSLSDVPTR